MKGRYIKTESLEQIKETLKNIDDLIDENNEAKR